MKAWKNAEKEVARVLGGKRRIRVSYDESIGDIIHPYYSIEVKYGKQIPKYCITNVPLLLLTYGKAYRLIPSKDWCKRRNMRHGFKVVNSKAEFLSKAFKQARSYDTKKPIVCVKPRRYRGFVIIMED